MRATVLKPIRIKSTGEEFPLGSVIDREPEKILAWVERGLVSIQPPPPNAETEIPEANPVSVRGAESDRPGAGPEKIECHPVLTIGSWVKLSPPGDKVGQVVRCEEGEACVRIFNGYGHQDMKLPVSGLIPTAAPERPVPVPPTYKVGDRVEYSHKEALSVRTGVVVETRVFPSSTWYRLRDGDALRWVSEAHIQKKL